MRALAGIVVVLAWPAGAGSTAVPGELLVKFRPGTSPALQASALWRVGAQRTGFIPGIDVTVASVVAGREEAALGALRADYRVQYAEQEVLFRVAATTPSDLLWSTETGFQEVSAPEAWDLTRGVPATVVAVLDSGVDFTHPDLAGGAVPGYDFANHDADASDDFGHGTSVAGIIAARGDGQGMAGLCWQCLVMPVKVIDSLGSGTSTTLSAGLVWAADHGADVINMSVGGPTPSAAVADAVRYAADHGAVLVASAGNDASTSPFYPAAYPDVISVAASTPAKTLYAFSNRGDWVRLSAPGCNTATFLLGSWEYFCGTSSSAPVVAGAAALARSLYPSATRAAVTTAMQSTAVPLMESGGGAGRVDAYAALRALAPPAPAAPPVSPPATTATPPPDTTVGTGSTAAPPRALRRPSIVGRARVGRRLRVRAGTWSGAAPITLRYRWLRCRTATVRCLPIGGATRPRYRVGRRDRGFYLRVAVTARNSAGSEVQVSRPTRRVR
jgi:subtilisin family serine protease